MGEHTKTPWQIGITLYPYVHFYGPSDKDGFSVAIGSCVTAFGKENDEANAAFIVKCVNSHAALVKALEEIKALEPKLFAMPSNWHEQIAGCAECQRYKDHPIQQGICNTHRRPLYERERHDRFEEKAIGYRAQSIAREALRSVAPHPAAEPREGV